MENTGNVSAYVRIYVGVPAALEESTTGAGKNVLHWNIGNRFDASGTGAYNDDDTNSPYKTGMTYSSVGTQSIEGIAYNIYAFTCNDALEAKAISPAAFVGFYLDSLVDYNDEDGYYYYGSKDDKANRITVDGVGAEDKAAFDFSNGVNIPVFALAIQADGFENAAEAFTTGGFGDNYNPWSDGKADFPVHVTASNTADLKAAFATKGSVVVTLENDIAISERLYVTQGCNVTLDMNGKSMTMGNANADPMITTWSKSTLTITGNGTIDCGDNSIANILLPGGTVIIENGNFLRSNCTNMNASLFAAYKDDKNANTIIKGGYFDGGYRGTNCEELCLSLINIAENGGPVTIYGGTFVGQNPAWGDQGHATYCPHCTANGQWCHGTFLEGQEITDTELPAGYTITEGTTTDGRTTYTVNYTKP